ncbi:hypothetical protein BDD12DRAFT_554656 [Trichophaea hybrida]|nr:hypothetical protein BDD12DRAFT_554656 [Trichophaea hybrida]
MLVGWPLHVKLGWSFGLGFFVTSMGLCYMQRLSLLLSKGQTCDTVIMSCLVLVSSITNISTRAFPTVLVNHLGSLRNKNLGRRVEYYILLLFLRLFLLSFLDICINGWSRVHFAPVILDALR